MIKIRSELKDILAKGTIQRINKSWSRFFQNIKKLINPLSRLIKKKRDRAQINTIRNERGETTTDTTQRTVRNYYEELYAKKFENMGEINKF